MKRNVYAEINHHITWHTKLNHPTIMGRIEERLHAYLRHKIVSTPGAVCHAIGSVQDHIHLAVSVGPTLLLSDWIGRLKGGSSRYINAEVARERVLEWQEGYGVVSFGSRDLEWVVRYVRDQKQRHARGNIIERLERIYVES